MFENRSWKYFIISADTKQLPKCLVGRSHCFVSSIRPMLYQGNNKYIMSLPNMKDLSRPVCPFQCLPAVWLITTISLLTCLSN